ncbi:MAG: S9 family peptidase [Phycisphaerae bacterium]|nr:S9 family peptidase [Phycisphaerae bacterium]
MFLAFITLLLASGNPLTLKEMMRDPDWMGRSPSRVWWTDGGQSVLLRRPHANGITDELVLIDLASGGETIVADADIATMTMPGGDVSPDLGRRVYSQDGDLFLWDDAAGQTSRLTNTHARETNPQFMSDEGSIQFLRNGRFVIRHLESNSEFEPRGFIFADEEKDDSKSDPDFRQAQQERLIETIGERSRRSETRKARGEAIDEANTVQRPEDIRLGAGRSQRQASLSPSGNWVAITSTGSSKRGKRDSMPRYVTDSSYVDTESVRVMVGESETDSHAITLANLKDGSFHHVDLSTLPDITKDPLEWLDSRNNNSTESNDNSEEKQEAEPRPVRITSLRWSPDGQWLVMQLYSHDHKDRWIAGIDTELITETEPPELVSIHHLHDEAWICRSFNSMDWMRDGQELWFQSEESGWGHLYKWDPASGGITPLTQGQWETQQVAEGPKDGLLWFVAGRDRPTEREVFTVDPLDGTITQHTDFNQSVDSYSLSPDGSQLLMKVSSAVHPPEVVVQDTIPGSIARWLTESRSPEYLNTDLIEPRIIRIPSPHGADIWAKLYLPDETAPQPRPAVFFLHGAGYLQNADNQWSNYAREALFNMHLARQGYVVLDIDYRASSGYGRDWRTAIYRNMGTPEVQDMQIAVDWLVANHQVDPSRVGAYGGSYGGFLVLMAMFTDPDLLACGASLRPVTDWSHYYDGYTRPILNTPERDPEAYRSSSPIEHAEGLDRALLICHGMEDNNVLFKDTVRLAQRLIELEKRDWEVAMYPMEAHGFKEHSSWLDEYRRIDELFREWLLEHADQDKSDNR